jgi:hypothetical protein
MPGLIDYNQMVQQLMQQGGGGLLSDVAQRNPMQSKMLDPRGGTEGAIGYGGGSNAAPSVFGKNRYAPTQAELLNDPGYVKSRIRQIEYDRRLAGHKVDGQYPPHGELHMLRSRLKELLAGQ